MAFAAAYAAPLRASMVPVALKRAITARSVNAAAGPADRPVTASSPVPLGVASNSTVNDPVCAAASGVLPHVRELTAQPGGGGEACTVTTADPPCPSLVAVIVADPAARPVTSPALLTARPERALPFASLGVAVSCTLWPTGTLADDGDSVTVATGTWHPDTVTLAVSDRSPGWLVAMTWNAPQLAFR